MTILNPAIENIRETRNELLRNPAWYREAELLYQLTSLVMEIDQHLGGGYLSMETIYEKTEIVANICKNIKMEMNNNDEYDEDPDLKFPNRITKNQK